MEPSKHPVAALSEEIKLHETIAGDEDWLAREKERCERVEEECYQKGRHDGLAAGRAEGVKALEAVQAEACSGWGFDVVDRVRSLIDAQLAAMGKKE